MKSLRVTLALACLALITAIASSALSDSPAYKVIGKISPGGDGGWDYLTVDPAAHRLYVARSSHVQVVDLDKDSVIADIPNTIGVHGVALVPELGRGFTSNGRDSSVTIFDLETLAALTTVKIPARNPDAITYDAFSKRVFTFNGGSGSATAIDAATGAVAGTVDLGDKPEAAVSDGKGKMYVNLEDSSFVAVFNTKTLKVLARWPLAPGRNPTGIAFDQAHKRLFSACGGSKTMVVLNSDNGKIVASLPIGSSDGAAFDSGTQLAFSTNGEGTLTVLHEDSPNKYSVVGDVPTQRGARTIALDETNHRIYTDTAEFGERPAATPENPRPRAPIVPGSFVILKLAP